MTREERASTQVSSQSPLTGASKIPLEVYEQLTKDFVPAVKEAVIAGQELLHNYQALDKSSATYATCLEKLAKSSDSADIKAKEYGKELHDILKDYKLYVEYHRDCIKELDGIVKTTTAYGNEEKGKLKDMYSKYQKDEKEILKAQRKGLKKQSEVDSFYENSAREFLRQQELRYKFFLNKHKRWSTRYWNLMEKIQTERGIIPNGHTAEAITVLPEVVPHADVYEDPIPNGVVVAAKTPQHEEVHPVVVAVAAEAPKENGINDDPPFLHTGNSSPRSSISSLDKIPSRRNTNDNIPGVKLIHNERRDNPDRRLSALHEYKFETASPPVTTVSAGVQAEIPPPVVKDTVVPTAPRRKYEYTGPIIMPAPVINTREPEVIQSRTVVPPTVVPRTVDNPIYASPQIYNYVAPTGERPHYHVESEYNPSISPAHRPVSQNFTKPSAEQLVVPSMFNASDYGRALTVTQDFNATSGEQMTVNRGDKVILIKSGSRGWIFIQDQATQRTGWIPAFFASY